MAGKPGRSGRPKRAKNQAKTDGLPESPRVLSQKAKKYFDWLLERLGTAENGSPWGRIDGASVAGLAELLEDQENLAKAIATDPTNVSLLRLRLQYNDRLYKFSGIVGLTPRDRERLPQSKALDLDDADQWEQGQ